MFQKLFTRRRAVAVATVALGMSGMTLAFAGTAGAADPNPNSTLMVGSGSNTAYSLMVSEGDLFNTSPGCDLTGAGKDAANENCGTDPVAPADAQVNTLNSGENGFAQADENPYNDYTVQAPAVGSGAGVSQLNSSTGFQPDYARSSANPAGSGGTSAQNYEAYAVDGISWTAFKSKGSTLYPANYVPTLTTQQLTNIWAGTVPACSKKVNNVTTSIAANNWACLDTATSLTTAVFAVVHKGIDCYIPQSGSGTAGTWATDFGYNKSETTGACLNTEAHGTAASHINLFENQMAQIASGKINGVTNNDQPDAIYFMSYGKFHSTCTSITAAKTSPLTAITGKCAGATAYTTVLGDQTGGSPAKTLSPSQSDIQGLGGGAYTAGDEWFENRNLYNVYNNSTSPAARRSNQATLNLVSEYGFMCKPGTVGDFDPLTGVNYRTEIEAKIKSQGFFPIDTSDLKPFKEGSVTNPAGITDTFYTAVDKTLTAEKGTGPGSATAAGNGIPTTETNTVSNPYGFCQSTNG
jgi:hypothetical protein